MAVCKGVACRNCCCSSHIHLEYRAPPCGALNSSQYPCEKNDVSYVQWQQDALPRFVQSHHRASRGLEIMVATQCDFSKRIELSPTYVGLPPRPRRVSLAAVGVTPPLPSLRLPVFPRHRKTQQQLDAKNAEVVAQQQPRVSYEEALKSHKPRAWIGARKKVAWGRLFGPSDSGKQEQ